MHIITRQPTNSEKDQAAQQIAEWIESEFECNAEEAAQVAKSAITKVNYRPPSTYRSLEVVEQLTLLCKQYVDQNPGEF